MTKLVDRLPPLKYNISMKSYAVPVTIVDETTTITTDSIPVNGKLRGIVISAPTITGTSYTITVKDKYGFTVFTRTI